MIHADITTLRAHLFRALGDRTRLEILRILEEEGSATVSRICERLDKEQNLISHHLGCLRNCGFVKTEREGRNIIYSLRDERVLEILRIADIHIVDVLEGILSCEVVRKKESMTP